MGTETDKNENHEVHYHRLNTPQSEDVKLFTATELGKVLFYPIKFVKLYGRSFEKNILDNTQIFFSKFHYSVFFHLLGSSTLFFSTKILPCVMLLLTLKVFWGIYIFILRTQRLFSRSWSNRWWEDFNNYLIWKLCWCQQAFYIKVSTKELISTHLSILSSESLKKWTRRSTTKYYF